MPIELTDEDRTKIAAAFRDAVRATQAGWEHRAAIENIVSEYGASILVDELVELYAREGWQDEDADEMLKSIVAEVTMDPPESDE